MEPLHQQMLERYKTLIHKEVEIADQYQKLDLAKGQLESEIEGAKSYLQTGFHDPVIKKEFQKIAELKKELTSATKRAQKVVESKSHVVIRLLQQHAQEGLEVGEIMTLLPSYGAEVDRNSVTTILGKLRKRGTALKERNKFFITEPGKNSKPTSDTEQAKAL